MSLLPSIQDVVDMSNGVYKSPAVKKLSNKKNYLRKKARKKKKQKFKARPFVRPNYKIYMKSQAWRTRKNKYFAVYGKQCAVCSSHYRVGVHHISYKNLGRELDEDLVVLCWLHHNAYHDAHGVKSNNAETHKFIDEERQALEFSALVKTL